VRKYLGRVGCHEVPDLEFDIRESHYPTIGPKNRYGAILFIEKEGFMPLFREVRLAERYDIAIMSTKGMSVTASRELVQGICAGYEVPLYVLHDFDISGFSIFGTLAKSTRRFHYSRKFKVVDLGLRLDDVEGLETEDVWVQSETKTRNTLQRHGATQAEIDFLLEQRVELNAFASDELVAWIERKLQEHGVNKVVPDEAELTQAYHRMYRQALVQSRIKAAAAAASKVGAAVPDPIPDELRTRLENELRIKPEGSWDAALREIAEQDYLSLWGEGGGR
jgi:hypothetical protein